MLLFNMYSLDTSYTSFQKKWRPNTLDVQILKSDMKRNIFVFKMPADLWDQRLVSTTENVPSTVLVRTIHMCVYLYVCPCISFLK